MMDFDRFTMDIADGDPVKRQALERGTITEYWDAAVAYATRLAAAHKAAENARKNAERVTSRRGH